jgi:hypothetical protein
MGFAGFAAYPHALGGENKKLCYFRFYSFPKIGGRVIFALT